MSIERMVKIFVMFPLLPTLLLGILGIITWLSGESQVVFMSYFYAIYSYAIPFTITGVVLTPLIEHFLPEEESSERI